MTITETLQSSIMLETIKVFIETEYNRFYADPSDLTLEELENLERACRIAGKTCYAVSVSVYLEKLNS